MLFYRIPSYLYRIFLIIYKEFSVISYTEYSPLFKQNFPWFQTRSYFSWVLSSVIYPRLFRTTVEPHKMSILDVAYGRWSLTWASLDHNENVNCWDFTHEPMPMQFVHVKSISRKKISSSQWEISVLCTSKNTIMLKHLIQRFQPSRFGRKPPFFRRTFQTSRFRLIFSWFLKLVYLAWFFAVFLCLISLFSAAFCRFSVVSRPFLPFWHPSMSLR